MDGELARWSGASAGQGQHGTRRGSPESNNRVQSEPPKILTQLLNNPEID